MKKFGACFVGCGKIVQSLGQKCMDIESANGSEQTEDKKLASPIQMEVDDAQSPEENQNSNNIECSERSNISCLYFLFEFFLTFFGLYPYISGPNFARSHHNQQNMHQIFWGDKQCLQGCRFNY